MTNKLILVRGLPGSGKSTFARSLGIPDHFEADQYFVGDDGVYRFDASQLYQAHRDCQHRTRNALVAGRDVVVSNTFTTHREMREYVAMADELNVELVVYVASGDYGSIHDVPDEAIARMRARWADWAGEQLA